MLSRRSPDDTSPTPTAAPLRTDLGLHADLRLRVESTLARHAWRGLVMRADDVAASLGVPCAAVALELKRLEREGRAEVNHRGGGQEWWWFKRRADYPHCLAELD